jgi:hypothetical protein
MAEDFTIDIPGALDIFRIKPGKLEDKERRKQRIIRMATANSPMPEAIRWIPSVINMLDDIEDLASTLLTLARPLLRKLPTRFVPILGWVLLATDVVNLTTATLGVAAGGRGGKRVIANASKFFGKNRVRPTARVAQFLGKFPILSFALQSPQALENITGFGLRLGGIMGMLSDTFWGFLRSLGGGKVVFRGPPGSTLGEKAARVLTQIFQLGGPNLPLGVEDMNEVIAGHKLASAILREQPSATRVENRFEDALQTEVPVFIPWNEASREALQEADIPVDDNIKPYILSANDTDTIGNVISQMVSIENAVQDQCKRNLGQSEDANMMQLVYDEAGIDTLETVITDVQVIKYVPTNEQKVAMIMAEFGFFPPFVPAASTFMEFTQAVIDFAIIRGTKTFNVGVIHDMMNFFFGGIASHSPGKFFTDEKLEFPWFIEFDPEFPEVFPTVEEFRAGLARAASIF